MKINVGRWITILPLESHLGRWINTAWSGPSDHATWRRGNIAKKSAIFLRLIVDILPPEAIFSQNHLFISLSRYIADILAIFAEISPLRFFSTKYYVDPSRYIPTFSSLVWLTLLVSTYICFSRAAWISFLFNFDLLHKY